MTPGGAPRDNPGPNGRPLRRDAGWIDKAKIEKYCFPPSEDTLLFVCGLPPMYQILCGPRTEKELAEGTVLHQLGYTTSMVAKM